MTAFYATLFLPLTAFVLILCMPKDGIKAIKSVALASSILAFVASLVLFLSFDSAVGGFSFSDEIMISQKFDIGFRVGLDGMSILLVMLTTFIMPIALLSSFGAIDKRNKEYYSMLMLLQFAMTGVFSATDLVLFYIFWEIILIPMYFIIGIWGGKNRIYAAVKFFIFTAVGSLLMLVAIVWVGNYAGTSLGLPGGFTASYEAIRTVMTTNPPSAEIQAWLFFAFALSFCIKVPLFPLHTWLPDAHTEAPTPGSVILAAVLLKMGTYGLIRFNLGLFPLASIRFAELFGWLAVAGIVYGALVSMVQTDIKKLVAYSSVSHLGFVVLGIFSVTAEGIQGAIIQMINHGLSTGMLFLSVGVLYERRHTRQIEDFGGIARVMPVFTVLFGVALFASAGLPGLNGFVGEYLTLIGAFKSSVYSSIAFAVVASSGVIFAAIYLLRMFGKVMFGTNDNPKNHNLPDLSAREVVMLVLPLLFVVWIGVNPGSFTKISENSTRALVNQVMKSKNPSAPPVFPQADNGNASAVK